METTETAPATATAPAKPRTLKQIRAEESRLTGKLLSALATVGTVAADLEKVRRQMAEAEAQTQAGGGSARARNGG